MPLYILPSKKRLFDYLQKDGLADELLNLNSFAKSKSSEIEFSAKEKTAIEVLFKAFGSPGLKKILSLLEAQKLTKKFDEAPDFYLTPKDILIEFLDRAVTLHKSLRNPGKRELAFRIYIGHDNNLTMQDRLYSIVIVPISSIVKEDGTVDHGEDLEETLFEKDRNKFFALVISEKIRIENGEDGIEACKDILTHKDNSGVQLVHHLFADLNGFMIHLDESETTFTQLQVEFGRLSDSKKSITIVITFLDENGNPIFSKIPDMNNVETRGISFDQGNLIPPPPITDSFFI